MANYVVKVGFSTDNIFFASEVYAVISEAFFDYLDACEGELDSCERPVVVTVGTIDESDIAQDDAFESEYSTFWEASRNPNPLPEGFPSL